MAEERAVFRGVDDVAIVAHVTDVVGDVLYITDEKGLTELSTLGITRRRLGVSRRMAYRWKPGIRAGIRENWSEMARF